MLLDNYLLLGNLGYKSVETALFKNSEASIGFTTYVVPLRCYLGVLKTLLPFINIGVTVHVSPDAICEGA